MRSCGQGDRAAIVAILGPRDTVLCVEPVFVGRQEFTVLLQRHCSLRKKEADCEEVYTIDTARLVWEENAGQEKDDEK